MNALDRELERSWARDYATRTAQEEIRARFSPRTLRFERPSGSDGPTYDPRRQCRATINLDGCVYRCGRAHVDGIHDAFLKHADQGWVRW